MKKLLILLLLISFISCREREIRSKNIDFVVIEKPILGDKYYLRSKDTILDVHPNDYMRYNINDTIKFKVDQEGFFKGTYFLRK